LFKQQVHFISGKGGVGKSVFSCSLAKYFAYCGLNTLLVQINAKDSHSLYLGTNSISSSVIKVQDNIFSINLSPLFCIKEYISLKFKSNMLKWVSVGEKKINNFLNFVPGLSDLVMMGQIYFYFTAKNKKGSLLYDKIIVDCPTTGYSINFLDVANIVSKATKKGPLFNEAQKLSQLLYKNNSTLHLVTLPEEMPVLETISFLKEVREKKIINISFIILNNCIKKLTNNKYNFNINSVLDKEILNLYKDRNKRELIEKSCINYLENNISNEIIKFFHIFASNNKSKICVQILQSLIKIHAENFNE